jgi:hypothetical protein
MKWAHVVLILVLVAVCLNCAGSKKMSSPDGVKMKVPEWYADPPRSDDLLVGVATATSLDLQTAVDKAKQDGRAELARQIDLRVEGMSKRFVEETGLREDAELLDMFTQVSKSIVAESLTGSNLARQELSQEGSVYRAYVLMEMPIGEANARLLGKIRAQQQLYTRFRASQAFEELDKEVKEYEEWKKQQGYQ